jgi:hypothetical protein
MTSPNPEARTREGRVTVHLVIVLQNAKSEDYVQRFLLSFSAHSPLSIAPHR